ncbi:hypothetical protein F8M41_026473 [Gigaspora margarita]|uniref:CCHC-type domain-containing protein n=1 Tax=Gigaspora margarita TaxID=4874 RepID=A0A8H3XIE1_GIGMA|nr:hypothetical protein F8M41_026473 [Gigaspora margarita]
MNIQRDELTNLENISQENISRNCSVCVNTFCHCGVCGQAGHNAQTCGLDSSNKVNDIIQDDYSDYDNNNLILSVARHNVYNNPNHDNKSYHCGVCGQTGHNSCTYSVKA